MIEYQINNTFIDNYIVYKIINDREVQVISNVLDRIQEVEIPEYVENQARKYKVIAIAEKSFYGCRYLDAVNISMSVKYIGKSAFEKSDIKSAYFLSDIPSPTNMIKLNSSLFFDCIRLEYVRLPFNLKKIPEFCFANCERLTDIEFGHHIEELGNMAFYQCESLNKFDFMESIRRIGDSCFQGSNIYYAEVHPNCEYVGDLAFADIDNLQTLVIANSKATFGELFAKNDRRVTVYIEGKEENEEVKLLRDKLEDHHYFVVNNFVYSEIDGVIYLRFSKNVGRVVGYIDIDVEPHTVIRDIIGTTVITDWGPGAFKYSKTLISCMFPKTIKRIKGKVFEGCERLERVTFNHKITEDEAQWVLSNPGVRISYNYKEEE